LGETHAALFRGATPFAWFIIQHVATGGHAFNQGSSCSYTREPGPKTSEIERLVRGDHRVLDGFTLPRSLSSENPPRILPAHTIEITVVCGIGRERAND
jgi:hypothetical protein